MVNLHFFKYEYHINEYHNISSWMFLPDFFFNVSLLKSQMMSVWYPFLCFNPSCLAATRRSCPLRGTSVRRSWSRSIACSGWTPWSKRRRRRIFRWFFSWDVTKTWGFHQQIWSNWITLLLWMVFRQASQQTWGFEKEQIGIALDISIRATIS